MLRTATTWGISGPQFLWAYGALCVTAALGVWAGWRHALGPNRPAGEPLPKLSLYELAMLSGGPQLAITSAATQLHRDGLLQVGPVSRTFVAVGTLDPAADPLERAVWETVDRRPRSTAAEMRTELADSEAVHAMKAQLTSRGLLVDAEHTARLQRLSIVGGLLLALGAIRLAAEMADDAEVGWLALMVAAVGLATAWLARARPLATNYGNDIVGRWRRDRNDLHRNPIPGESALAAALFGGAALWLAEPAIASALGVPREENHRWAGGGGSCSSGSGWSADSGGSGGSGGCGGGGCSGGGG
jgi:uncharacterized protein (TIGR04222 family)